MTYGLGYKGPEVVESALTSGNDDVKCVNNSDASTSCADKVEIEDCESEDDKCDKKVKNSGFKNDKSAYKPLKNLSKSPFVKPAANGKSEKYTFKYTNEQLCRLKEIASSNQRK